MYNLLEIVQNAEYDGYEFWICAFENEKLRSKPTRNIKPTHVVLVPNSTEQPFRKGRYYFDDNCDWLVAWSDDRKPMPADSNIMAFKTYEECVEQYNELVKIVARKIDAMYNKTIGNIIECTQQS